MNVNALLSRSELDRHIAAIRRIAEHREYKAEKEMLDAFIACYKDIEGFLGNEYAKYAQDDRLTFEILHQKGEYARFMDEFINRYDYVTKQCYSTIDALVNDTYKLCYQGIVDGVAKSKKAEDLHKQFKAVRAVTPETIKRSVQNPIPKLRLSPVLERNRKKVIDGIRREVTMGLTQGDRMSTMARRITHTVKTGYTQSMLIARTEAHRVREAGFNDASNRIDGILKDNNSEYRIVKMWRTMKDSAVRHTNLANHKDMQDQTVLQDEKFKLVSGAETDAPGQSGIAAEDCNCRCYVSRDIMNDEEFYTVTGRHFSEKVFTNQEKRGIISSRGGTVALENQRYGRNKDTLVNKTYIESGEYRRKFDSISSNKEVNRTLYNKAKEALKHRSGTNLEDMFWIDSETGNVVAQEITQKIEKKVIYSKSTEHAVKNYEAGKLITIHNHPSSMPPSIDDFNSCYRNKYSMSYVLCHNGRVYGYKSEQLISPALYDAYVGAGIRDGLSEFDAQINAIQKLCTNHMISFWEVH